ncbi:MAG: hypothetical protein ABIS06_04515 [Vicinamibacterales bacterium]
MRHRRAQRCVLRAEAALQSGDEAVAREALAEAKHLDWKTPEFETVRASLLAKRAEIEAAAAAEAAAARAARRQGARRAVAAAAIGIAVFGGSAAVIYRASGHGRSVSSAPLTLATPLPSSSASASSISPTPQDTNAPGHEEATAQPSSVKVPPVAAPAAPGTENQVATAPAAPSQELLPASRNTAAMTRDVPVQTTPTSLEAPPVATPSVGTSPFSTAPGNVAAVPLPPVAPADEERPRPESTVAPSPSLLPPAPESAPTPAVDETARVRSLLSRYEAAYTGLDANAAQLIWPGVDSRSLARAFQGLESQRVSLGHCALAIDGATARADCDGSATWTPKIGGGSRTESRHWRFELQNHDGAWQILTASAR